MSRQIIRPQLNEPVVVQIACEEAQKVQSERNGQPETQWLYALNSNEAMMYATAIVHNAIEKSGPPARQNGNAYQEPATRPAPKEVQEAATRAANIPAAAPRENYPLADSFIPFLRAAAIACKEISKEAKSNGYALNFNTRDISAIASTLFIQTSKGGR